MANSVARRVKPQQRHGALAAVAGGLAAWAWTPAAAAQSGYNVWTSNNLLGDWGGVRLALVQDGVTLGIQDAENLLGNVSGGVRQGATMQGVTTATLQLDTNA